MAIPNRKLELKELDFKDLTLNDVLVYTGEIEGIDGLKVLRFWLKDNSKNWTLEDIGRIRISDLPEVVRMITEEVEKQSVPLEK